MCEAFCETGECEEKCPCADCHEDREARADIEWYEHIALSWGI